MRKIITITVEGTEGKKPIFRSVAIDEKTNALPQELDVEIWLQDLIDTYYSENNVI